MSESSAASSSSQSEESDLEKDDMGTLGGLHLANPHFYHWIVSRIGTRSKVCLITSFIVLEAFKFLLAEHAYVEGVNTFSILVATNLTSLILAVVLSVFLEGVYVLKTVISVHPFVRFMGVAVLFTFASVLILIAYRIGTPPAEVVTVGYIYMPISTVLSYYVFRRRYGNLEWLSMGMMGLSILAFILIREESKSDASLRLGFDIPGFGLTVVAVAISVLASILAERIFKDRSGGLIRQRGARQDKFYIMKIHLDFSSLVISVCLWLAPVSMSAMFRDFFQQWSHSKDWFGTWNQYQYLMVLVAVGQGWAAGLVTKEFSTVIKAIVQSLSVVLFMLLGDPLMGNRFHFQSREVPSILLAVIILLSAMIFQTGRINLRVIRKAVNLGPEAHPSLNLGVLASPEDEGAASPALQNVASAGRPYLKTGGASPRLKKEADASAEKGSSTEEDKKPLLAVACEEEDEGGTFSGYMKVITTYALILVYILSDAGRTLVLQKALSTTVVNSTSMGLVCYVCGVLVASGLTFYTHGFEGLRQAFDWRKILHCLPAAFLFALATTLGNLSFANGITSSLYVVLGKFYTPVAALCARWIMGKFYMWLEWFALVILTLSSVVFGYLKSFNVTDANGVPKDEPITGMFLVLASAATSAVGSLVTEKILKGEQVPFHMQKVRLDMGSILSSMVLLPVIGLIATRPQDIPWAGRPTSYGTCPWDSVCWQTPHSNHSCSNPDCTCPCETGVFAGWDLGWDSWVLVLAVLVNTTQGWLVGRVTQRFSVVHRAIADSFSLLAIYFVGDPILNHTSLSNVSLNLVAFVVPLSTATFSVATSEMQRVFQAQSKLTDSPTRSRKQSEGDSDSESELSEVSTGFGISGGASPKRFTSLSKRTA